MRLLCVLPAQESVSDLAATMDIQIPALAWRQTGPDRYRRTLFAGSRPCPVEIAPLDDGLGVWTSADATADEELRSRMRRTFPDRIAELDLGPDPVLRGLARQYGGVAVMWTEPFEALLLTILSQNRTGEIVRAVFPPLAEAAGGVTPAHILALGEQRLRALIRSAGPYKAPRLLALCARLVEEGPGSFEAAVLGQPPGKALAYLESLPGVAHKTAACVLVFAARAQETLPVDTHLFRVADRLGVARHDGRLTAASRTHIVDSLLAHGADVARAHFLFLLLGRDVCGAGRPACDRCPLCSLCSYATAVRPGGGAL